MTQLITYIASGYLCKRVTQPSTKLNALKLVYIIYLNYSQSASTLYISLLQGSCCHFCFFSYFPIPIVFGKYFIIFIIYSCIYLLCFSSFASLLITYKTPILGSVDSELCFFNTLSTFVSLLFNLNLLLFL